jgi:ankyrin repeat protein
MWHVQILQAMLAKGADVNCQNKHGDSPLHQAAQRGRDQNVLFLLNNKANANLPNKYDKDKIATFPSSSYFSELGKVKLLYTPQFESVKLPSRRCLLRWDK